MSSAPPRPQPADTFLAREYGRMRADVLAGLRGRLATHRIAFDDADLDGFYNQAWHALYDRLADGEHVENAAGFLVTVGYRRAIEEFRRLRPDRRAGDADPAAIGVDDDLAGRLDDRVRLHQLVEGMKDRLDEREAKAASLCLIHGFTRPEAAGILGESPKRMEKVMDGVQRKLATLTTDITAGRWCENRRSLMKAYALGLLPEGGARRQLATEHLRDCPACRRYVQALRGLAAVVPPVALPVGGGAGVDRLNGLLTAAWAHAGEVAGVVGGHAGEAGAAAAAGAGAAAAHVGGGHGGAGAVVAKVAATVAVAGVCTTAGLAIAGVLGPADEPARDTRATTPAATTPAPTPAAPATATAAARAQRRAAARRKARAAARRKARAARRAPSRAAPAAAAPPAAAPAPAPAPAPATAAPGPAPQHEIVTDAAQEFGP